jgi:hypothetical protein
MSDTTVMYRIGGYGKLKIEQRRVVKQTAQQIEFYDVSWNGIEETKTRREYSKNNWFMTEREAAQEIIRRYEEDVDAAKKRYDYARSRLGDVQAEFKSLLAEQQDVAALA